MKIESDFHNMTLIPESNEDWFEAGRITKNLGIKIIKNNQHLNSTIESIELPIKIVLNVLAEGEIKN
jgi:hypothetical protein